MKKLLMMVLALGLLSATTSMASDTTVEEPAEAAVEKTAVETGVGEGEPSKWNKAGEEVKEAAHAVGDATVDTSKKVWGATKEESAGVWDKTKSKSKEIWEKGKAKVHDATAPKAADEDADDAASDTAAEEARPTEGH